MSDTPQTIAVRISRAFWDMVATFAMNTGIGFVLAFIALWYGGFVHWIFAAIMISVGVFLIWTADPQRLRYLRWRRPVDDAK